MSADTYEELKIRLECLIEEIKGIRCDISYDRWSCRKVEELRKLIEEAKEELELL